MFDSLVFEAEEKIYKKAKANKEVRRVQITCGIVFLILSVFICLSYCLQWGAAFSIMVGVVVNTVVYMKWEEYEKRKYRRKIRESYKTNIVEKWVQLLAEQHWDLYI